MAAPIDVERFKELAIAPPEAVDEFLARPGRADWITRRLEFVWSRIQGVLRKRYDVETMASDPPEVVIEWLVDIVTKDFYDARGWDPSGASDESAIRERAKAARDEMREAANSTEGLIELPQLASTPGDGVVKSGPLASSEQSPYTWIDIQAPVARDEDDNNSQ